MILAFDAMETTELAQFYGGEKCVRAKMHMDGLNRIMLTRLEPGASIGMHTHETSSEIIYILSGSGKVICDGETEILHTGSCHFCPKGHTHSLINDSNGDLAFFAVIPEQ